MSESWLPMFSSVVGQAVDRGAVLRKGGRVVIIGAVWMLRDFLLAVIYFELLFKYAEFEWRVS